MTVSSKCAGLAIKEHRTYPSCGQYTDSRPLQDLCAIINNLDVLEDLRSGPLLGQFSSRY